MLLSPRSSADKRERISSALAMAARASLAALLVVSPMGLRWTILQRQIVNVYQIYTDFYVWFGDIFLILTLGFWSLSLGVLRRPVNHGPRFLTWAILGLVLLSWAGVLTGIDPALTAFQSLRFTLLFLLYLFLVNVTLTPQSIAIPLALGVTSQSLVALVQFVTQHSLGLGYLGELVLDPEDLNASILNVGTPKVLRAYGLTDHPNLLGGFLAFAMVVTFGYYLYSASRRGRYWLLAPLALGSTPLLVSFSYPSLVAFLAGVAFLILMRLANRARLEANTSDIILAALVILFALVLPPFISPVLWQNYSFENNPEAQPSLAERDAVNLSADRIFYNHEWMGVGNGALPEAMRKLDSQFPLWANYEPAPFVMLDVGSELGLLGAYCWFWLLIVPWVAIAIKRKEFVESAWLAATAAALLVITILGFFDYYPWLLPGGRVWQWSAWGLTGWAFVSLSGKRSTPPVIVDGQKPSSALPD